MRTAALASQARRSPRLAAPIAMIKTQLKPTKLASWVSGVTVKHANITEMITAMVLRSEARISGRRVELLEGRPCIGDAHPA